MIRNTDKGQVCSTLPYQKPHTAEFPEKNAKAELIRRNYCPSAHPVYHNTHISSKGLTKNVIRILKRLQNPQLQ